MHYKINCIINDKEIIEERKYKLKTPVLTYWAKAIQ